MKALSSAIVVAAGLYSLSHAEPTFRGLPPLFSFVAAVIAVALGLVAWWAALKNER